MPYGFENLSPGELDLLVRVVFGEAGAEPDLGQQAVAAVIGNRLQSGKYGRSIRDVIMAPGQFEAMTRNAPQIARLDPRSVEYQRIRMNILGMQADPTGGALQFYSPGNMAEPPTWARGRQAQDIGGHRFIGGTGGSSTINIPSPVVNQPTFAPVMTPTGVRSVPIPPPRPLSQLDEPVTTGSVPGAAPRPGVPGVAPTGNPALDAALAKVSPELRENFMRALGSAPPDIRTAIGINSGLRTIDRQRELFEQKLKETGGDVAAARKWVAPPGRSMHERGNALDLSYQSPAAKTWMHQNAGNFGLSFPMPHEPWHVEPAGVRGAPKVLPPEAGGPPAGQPTPTPRVGELPVVAPAATPIPAVTPQAPVPAAAPANPLAGLIASLSGSGDALSGLGSSGGGGAGGGGPSVSPGIENAGYDEQLGRLGATALRAPVAFDNLQGIGSVGKPKIELPDFGQIGSAQGGRGGASTKQMALLRKLLAGL